MRHIAEVASVYDYGDTIINEGDLFDKEAANAEFNGYTVNVYQFGPAVLIMVEEKEPKLRKIWRIFCCETHASRFLNALGEANPQPK